MASLPPLRKPYLFKANTPYSEQVGEYLHVAGNNGEIAYWYTLIKKMKIKEGNLDISSQTTQN